MNFRFFLLLFFCNQLLSAKEWVPDFQVIEQKKDSSIKENVFFITFQFSGIDDGKEILMSHNKQELKIVPDKKKRYTLKLKPGKYEFKFYVDKKHSEVKSGEYAFKAGYRVLAEVLFENVDMPRVVEKPVIYLYPEKKEKVCVALDVKGKMGFTYPPYHKGWEFLVDSNGKINKDGRVYNYLFWDAETEIKTDNFFNEGFVCDKNALLKFMEEKLQQMGLSASEREDFITYWCPRMMQNEKIMLQFVFNDSCNQFAELNIQPVPAHVFRVYVVWRRAFEREKIKEQKMEIFNRNGFSVLEWGGMELAAPKNICE